MQAGRRVLVVDDNASVLELIGMVLADDGFEVRTAPHGLAALRLLEHWQPHAILLDMEMPVMDGWGFVNAYRQQPGPHAPIIIVTAAMEAERRALQVGAEGYVGKPFQLEELLQTVRRYARGA